NSFKLKQSQLSSRKTTRGTDEQGSLPSWAPAPFLDVLAANSASGLHFLLAMYCPRRQDNSILQIYLWQDPGVPPWSLNLSACSLSGLIRTMPITTRVAWRPCTGEPATS